MSIIIERNISDLINETKKINSVSSQIDQSEYNKLKNKSIYSIGEYNINIKIEDKIKEIIERNKSKYKALYGKQLSMMHIAPEKDIKYNINNLNDFQVLEKKPDGLCDEVNFFIEFEDSKKPNEVYIHPILAYIIHYDGSGNKITLGGKVNKKKVLDTNESITLYIKYIN